MKYLLMSTILIEEYAEFLTLHYCQSVIRVLSGCVMRGICSPQPKEENKGNICKTHLDRLSLLFRLTLPSGY